MSITKRLVIIIVLVSVVVSSIGLGCLPIKAAPSEDYKTFYQNDPRWNKVRCKAGYYLKDAGCLITSISIMMAYADPNLRDVDKFNPIIFGNAKTTTYTGGGLDFVACYNYNKTFKRIGSYNSSTKEKDKQRIKSLLDKGYYVILCAGPPVASSSTHWSPVVGWDKDRDEPIIFNVYDSKATGGYNDSWSKKNRWGDKLIYIVYYKSTVNPSTEALAGNVTAGTDAEVDANVKRIEQITKEMDLVGMPEDFSFESKVDLAKKDSLSESEHRNVDYIQEGINIKKDSYSNIAFSIVSFIGLFIILYGILLGVAYLFDRSNNLVEISLLGILTLGKYRIWDDDRGVSPGYYAREKVMYCDSSILIKRLIVIELIGFALASGVIFKLIYSAFSYLFDVLKVFI